MRRMHDKIAKATIVYCEKCHQPKAPHKVCYNCGTYKKQTVFEINKEVKKVNQKTI